MPENAANCTKHKAEYELNIPSNRKFCDHVKNRTSEKLIEYTTRAFSLNDTKDKAADEDDGTRIQYNPLLLLLVGSAVILFCF